MDSITNRTAALLVVLFCLHCFALSLFAQPPYYGGPRGVFRQPTAYPPYATPPGAYGQSHYADYGYGQSVEPAWTQHVIAGKDRNVDFKSVAKGAHTEHRFIIKNPFEETLHITSIASSCSCTSVSLDGNKGTLETYDEVALVALFRTDLFDGPKSATITVTLDKPYPAVFQLNVRGEIRTDLAITPSSLRFDNVKEGEGASRTLTLTYRGPSPTWKIVDFKTDSEFLSGEVLETKSAQYGQITSKIKINLAPEAPSGELREKMFLISNDPAYRREIPLSVQATVGTIVRVAPERTFFGNLKPGEPSPVKTVSVRGTEAFTITGIRSDNPAVKIDCKPEPNGEPRRLYLLTVRYENPTEGDGAPAGDKMLATVTVETDNPDLKPTFRAVAVIAPPADESEPDN